MQSIDQGHTGTARQADGPQVSLDDRETSSAGDCSGAGPALDAKHAQLVSDRQAVIRTLLLVLLLPVGQQQCQQDASATAKIKQLTPFWQPSSGHQIEVDRIEVQLAPDKLP